jgi:NAD(P) transhydrogenase subunit beta
MTMPAVMATLLGGVAAGASVISALKLSRSPVRKSLPKLDEPRLPQVGAAVVALLLAMLFTAWPLMETFLWLELLTGLALGYLLTIHLKISDVPPVRAASLATAGLALSAAGMVLGNIVMVIAGALVAAGGAAAAESLCTAMDVSLPGLLLGTQSSKTSAAAEVDAPPPVPDPQPRPPRVPTSTADPNAPII